MPRQELYAIPTWTQVPAFIAEHHTLGDVFGGCPSQWALYRFTVKSARTHPHDACLSRVLASLSDVEPELGRDLAVDASDIAHLREWPAVPLEEPSRAGAVLRSGRILGPRSAVSTRRGGRSCGYKIDAAVASRPRLASASTPLDVRRG